MRRCKIFAFAAILSLSGCAGSGMTGGQIWATAEKRYLSESEAMARMAASDILLLGESHDNPDHHRLQAWAIRELTRLGQIRTLAFEMIGDDRQADVDGYLKRQPKSADGLGAALDWEKRGWPDFALYAPVFQAGMDAGWPIAAANLSKPDSTKIAKQDQLDAPERVRLGLDAPLPPELAVGLRADLIENHCGLLPESALPGMVRMQTAWDRKMASALIDGVKKSRNGSVLIAGAEHVRKDRAVPYQLSKLAPGLKVLAVAFKERPATMAEAERADLPYDLVWFTDAVPAVDHCAQLREHFGKKNGPK